jgi:glyoxylase-like metal-dependent hydrolase (beta-lactamase superfamily II)
MNRSIIPCLVLALLATACATTPTPDAPTLLREAQAAIGSSNLKTLVVTGAGTGSTFGQAYGADNTWPGLKLSTVTRAMNFETGALRNESMLSRSEPNGGGAIPLMGRGEARNMLFTRDGFAWGAAVAGNPAPNPSAVPLRQHELWTTTPHGALKAAAKYNAKSGSASVDGRRYDTLAFLVPGQLSATLYLDEMKRVVRIESLMPHPVLGDTPVITEFSDWKDMAGLKMPTRVRQRQGAGGAEVLNLVIAEASVDTPVEIDVPASVREFKERINYDPIAPGVWFITGGSHNSVAIELADQIVLVEAPQYDGRATALIEVAGTLVNGKKVKTVINSHHHFDHAGGLRAAAGEGAALITSALAKPYFEKAFANPNRIAPDRLARSTATPRILGVDGSMVLKDPLRPIEIHEIQGSIHARGFLMIWLPNEKLLIQGDAFTPGAQNAPPPPVPNPETVNLLRNIERLGWKPEAILPLHGRGVGMNDLLAAIGQAK